MPPPKPSLSKSQLAALDFIIAHMKENNQTQLGSLSFIDSIWNAVTDAASDVTNAVTNAATDAASAVTQIVTDAAPYVTQAATVATDALTQAAQTQAIQQAITSALLAAAGEARVADPKWQAAVQKLSAGRPTLQGVSLDQLVALRSKLSK